MDRRMYHSFTMTMSPSMTESDFNAELIANLNSFATDDTGHDALMRIESVTPTQRGTLVIISRMEPILSAEVIAALRGECEEAVECHGGIAAIGDGEWLAEDVVDVAFQTMWNEDNLGQDALRFAWHAYLASDSPSRWEQSRDREAAVECCAAILAEMVAKEATEAKARQRLAL